MVNIEKYQAMIMMDRMDRKKKEKSGLNMAQLRELYAGLEAKMDVNSIGKKRSKSDRHYLSGIKTGLELAMKVRRKNEIILPSGEIVKTDIGI